jgi:hypothetical protein
MNLIARILLILAAAVDRGVLASFGGWFDNTEDLGKPCLAFDKDRTLFSIVGSFSPGG